ncbi:reverse transcriptase domain-containing protein [Tanacetum coccineum]
MYPPTTSESSAGDSSFESSAKPSRKRCRSPAATVTLSIHTTRALVPSHTDLLPPRKRFRDSISLEDSVEEDIDTDNMTITRSGMTPEAIEELNDSDSDNGNSGDGKGRDGDGRNENPNENNGDARHVARECTYQDFIKYQPLNFKGTKGVVELIRWFEKMEIVFHISNCPEKYQVKYATCTLLNSALTWWNSRKNTIRTEAAFAMELTTRKSVRPLPSHRLALSYTSHHLDYFTFGSSSSHSSSDHLSSGHSISGHSLSGHTPLDTTNADSSTPQRFVHPSRARTPRCSESYLSWRSAQLSTMYLPTTSESSAGDSSSESSARPSRKRCRSPAATVTSSIHTTRALVPSCADLLPPCKRFRDSISLEDSVEEDIDMDAHVARECTYQDFIKCQPLNFKGTKGVVGLIRWFEKMEIVFHISNCPEKYQVKYATCTLLNSALTWWNSRKRTIGTEAAFAMSWRELIKLMAKVYCPRNEIQKIESELWNLTMKKNDLAAYT